MTPWKETITINRISLKAEFTIVSRNVPISNEDFLNIANVDKFNQNWDYIFFDSHKDYVMKSYLDCVKSEQKI